MDDNVAISTTVDPESQVQAAIAVDPNPDGPARDKNVHAQLRVKIAQSRTFIRELVPEWALNIDYRRGKPFATDSDQDRVAITVDWANTKDKIAQLFSQVPQVRLSAKQKAFEAGIPVFARKVNDTITAAGMGTASDECLPDVINACGIAAAYVSYETRTEMRDYTPPAPAAPPAPGSVPAPAPQVRQIPFTTAKRFIISHISPADLIVDVAYAGSDFNRGSLIGRRGRKKWSDAFKEFGQSATRPNGLTLEDKGKVCGKDNRSTLDLLSQNEDQDTYRDTEVVSFSEVFYWRYLYHDDERSFEAIQRVVYVDGLGSERGPVIDEQWTGQKRVENDGIAGACKFPIQVLTLAYVSDDLIPPSDSAMSRPQVDELIEGRSQMIMQRRYSIPVRTFDVNRVPPELVTVLMRGQWQGMIPTNGPGDRVFTETAKAAFPREDFEFYRVAKQDIDANWKTGGGLNGGGSGNTQIRSASEASAIQANVNTSMAYERARCVRWFCNIAEVLAGLVALYADFTAEEEQALAPLDRKRLAGYYLYTTRVDASVLLDAGQMYQRKEGFFNIFGKTGYLDIERIGKDMASLVGVDEDLIRKPEPKGPDPANISMRADADSLNNPIFVAMLMKMGLMPGPDELEAAKNLIIAAKQLPAPPQTVPPPGAPPQDPSQLPPEMQPTTLTSGDALPQADMASRINRRQQDGR